MSSAAKKVFFKDLAFEICENVYEPAEDSFFFAEELGSYQGLRVLDMGTGSGILGIVAAKTAKEVIAIDLNPYAVRCAKQNAILNRVRENMHFLVGDLFFPISNKGLFDLLLFNAPYLPSEDCKEITWLERAWAGGVMGRRVIDEFISGVDDHISKGGRVLLMQSTLSNVEETVSKMERKELATKVKKSIDVGFFETIVLIEAIHN